MTDLWIFIVHNIIKMAIHFTSTWASERFIILGDHFSHKTGYRGERISQACIPTKKIIWITISGHPEAGRYYELSGRSHNTHLLSEIVDSKKA